MKKIASFYSKRLSGYMSHHVCSACKGARLRPEALSVRIGGRSIHEIMSFTVEESGAFFNTLTLDNTQAIIAKQLLKEIQIIF